MKFLVTLFLMIGLAFASVNLNIASKEELMKIDGIGATKAQAIIDYREKTPFKTIEDLKKVKGFGDKTFEKVKDKISVETSQEVGQ
ncbi:ComEA family DNA-binding protein [Helicobacter sp. WB40]|uniref:ComEA family DNA-binding protein n=1 Tax=Helicobacter sp. WB40 TaxID=3004130 RepID=UPI0022EBE0CA|nr:helix-hairpin-helix domain-containing protein [Helicobacter sp. WB40]MDA3967653.1 helix-hairpin-helix domain-containing protein [Helicobacter sp. WB40]